VTSQVLDAVASRPGGPGRPIGMLWGMATAHADDRDRDPEELTQAVTVCAALLTAIDAVRRSATAEGVQTIDATRLWVAEP
jgi:hypothetical protein